MMIRKGMFIGDRYEIIDKVGSGGMSDVYKAMDHKLNRFVAVKVLKAEFCQDKSFISKFKIEAQAAAGLAHPNIVNVYDVGEDQGIHYIVMELIDGITLKKYVEKKGKLSVKDAVSIAIQVAQGIEAAHNNGIVHRDIKPQNIIISREGKVKVTDFGIARAASANTINSNAMGSVHYISPEQARGGYIDEKSDIYSLGITIYEMITGRVPFEGDSTVTIALQHIQEEIPSPKLFVPDLPISVEKIIEKCTQKKPERRYLKVSSLIADLKKSLISPDEDFVVLAPVTNNNATIMITDDEISIIKENAGKKAAYDGEETEDTENAENEENNGDDEWLGDSDDIDEGNPKLDKIIAIFGIIAAIAIVLVAVVVFSKTMSSCGGNSSTNEEGTNTTDDSIDPRNSIVPDLYEMTEDEAVKALEDKSLKAKIEREKSEEVAEGLVVRQSVKPGEVISKGTTVTIVISEGGKEFDIPDVVGKKYDEAFKILTEDYGLEVKPRYETSDEYESNTVVRTEPKAPIKLKRGDSIIVYISLGEDELQEVPDVLGKTKEKAVQELEALGFVVKVEEAYSDKVAKNKVITMNREVGSQLPKGETITITISKGEEETSAKEPETQETKYTASFVTFTDSEFRNVPEIPVEGTPGEGESESGEGETPATKKVTGTLSAYVKYDIGNSEVKTDVTDQLTSKEYSEGYAQTSSIEVVSTNKDVKGKNATLVVTLTYEDETGAEKSVEVYTYKAVFR